MKRVEYLAAWRKKSIQEVEQELLKESRALLSFRFRKVLKQVSDSAEGKKTRARIARLNFIIGEKLSAEQTSTSS